MSRRFVAAWLTVIAIGLISLPADANVIAIDNPYPTGDAAGTWDAVFTHQELAEIRSAGGLPLSLRGKIAARLAPAPAPLGTLRPVSPGVGATSSAEEWRWLVEAYFPAGWVEWGLKIIECESRGNPNAYNPSTASGLFQVKTFWLSEITWVTDLFDPTQNVQAAAYILTNYGAHHWACNSKI